MRKKTFRTAACLLLAAVVLASFAALASGGAGSQGDPLVTLSYLNDTFLTQVLEKVDKSLDERGGRLRGEIDQQIAQREQELRGQLSGGSPAAFHRSASGFWSTVSGFCPDTPSVPSSARSSRSRDWIMVRVWPVVS